MNRYVTILYEQQKESVTLELFYVRLVNKKFPIAGIFTFDRETTLKK